MKAVKEQAYAKINLHLECRARREDGFHDIRTVMYSLSLADEITVTLHSTDKKSIRLTLGEGVRLPQDRRNLVYLAAELFLERMAIRADISIKLEKHIPVAAGLGGGSADAAATLRALNRLFGRPSTERMLLSMAAELGSDVPFCLLGGAALCEGRGERITRLSTAARLHTVVAVSDEHISTPAAYAALDAAYSDFDGSVPFIKDEEYGRLMAYLSGEGELPHGLYNVFESVILPTCPGASAIRSQLFSLGAKAALMSGSGPSVFGIFESEAEALAARDALISSGYRAFYAFGIN
ncbi:MAG: 4-(cytidine 5'-diphospho)-2-C-methyl-D-erythritol kinase [Clostridia bacterium]|nr:4-(cytidine 5'-diphospho)-2-C-methyl-D-erythritol kinase [Clostridia bacterium]